MSIARIPNRSARLVAYVLAGLYGLAFAAIGGSWFVLGKGGLVAGFPSSPAEAVASAAGGAAVVGWAIARLRREMKAPR